MPSNSQNYQNSEEINDIITAVPVWILRWGIALIFFILLGMMLLSAFIRYPDVVKATVRINSLNAPKAVLSRQQGKLIKLLVNDHEFVQSNQALAYIESTASHKDVIFFAENLKQLNAKLATDSTIFPKDLVTSGLNLGELQGNYQSFYQEYLAFLNTQNNGFYHVQKAFLQKDLAEIRKLQKQIYQQQKIQLQEYANAEEEYHAYQTLKKKNVISNNEFKQQENKYLASKYPLQQSATALLNNNTSYLAKEKEIATLENAIKEQQAKFRQTLSSMINETSEWLRNYVITSPLNGRVGYSGILQENQNVSINQELFIINPGNTNFFGEISVPQYNMGKINVGQKALIKMRSFPFEEFGAINGKISFLTDAALEDSVFIAKVDFDKNKTMAITLKTGMVGDVEIITRERSLLQRLAYNITKMLDSN